MNREFLEKYQLYPKSIQYKNKVKIIEEQDKKYVVKQNRKKFPNLYSYLTSRNFLNFPNIYTSLEEEYEMSEYIEEIPVDEAQKVEDMIYLLSILHNKTTFYKKVELDALKKIYEDTISEYQYLFSYYQNIQSMIEEEIYMSPSHYYFILNISDTYQVLIKGKEALENWYKIVNEKKTLRFTLNHNNLEKDHLIVNNQLYFISWDKAENNFPIIDLVNLFQNNYDIIDIETLLSLYQSKYQLLDYEYYLFIAKICLLKRIDFNDSEDKKIETISSFIEYIKKIKDYFLKENTPKTTQNT